jgi:catechol 2,3-dioxygenase-like lactoylglutathione lyase family enzyme
MKVIAPRIHVVTLAVDDLERALTFYRDGLGLESPGIVGTEFVGDDRQAGGAAAMFDLDGGLILSLYGRSDLAKDAGIPVGAASSGAFSLGHLVSSREDVPRVLAQAVAAGAESLGEPHERPWGIYSAYFRDPDGHLWEIIWNPRMQPGQAGGAST